MQTALCPANPHPGVWKVRTAWAAATAIAMGLVPAPACAQTTTPSTVPRAAAAAAATVSPTPTLLRLQDLFKHPIGARGLEPTAALLAANGTTVRLSGYVAQEETPKPGSFLLSARPVQMTHASDGDADDLPPATVLVQLDASQSDWAVPHVRGLVSVQGVLTFARFESLGRVVWLRLALPPQAVRPMSLAERALQLHGIAHPH